MRKLFEITLASTCLFFSAFAYADSSSRTLQQDRAPIKITAYLASYQSKQEAASYTAARAEGVRHALVFRNESEKEIVAVQFGLAAFDAFNNYMGRINGWSFETVIPLNEKSGDWLQNPYATFTFQQYGTGVAFVNAVRFKDGTTWRANMNSILEQLRTLASELKPEDLLEKK
jgi:hypothetical protein